MDTIFPFLVFLVFGMLLVIRRPIDGWAMSGRLPLMPMDFQRILTQETGTKILWTKSWWEYWYFANIDGNPLYTRSYNRLEFPETCELIPFRLQ